MSSPVVVVVAGVAIVVSELALEAGAYTILFAVTVTMVDKAARDIADAATKGRWFNKCVGHYTTCMATSVGDAFGNHWKASLCNICFERCQTDQSWPVAVGNGSCKYWEKGWGN